MKKCIILYNKNSGKGNINQKKEQIFSFLISKNYYPVFIDLIEISNKTIKRIIKQGDFDLILSAGGDGTFNTLINKMIKYKSKIPISHIPIGSTNDIGNNFELSKLSDVINGDIIEIDIPKINNTVFSYVAALGTIPALSYNTPRIMKKNIGKLAYFVTGINSLIKSGIEKYSITYKVDNKTYEIDANEIIISNATGIGGFKNIFKSTKYNDSLFEVTMIKNNNISETSNILNSIFLYKKDITNVSNIRHFKTDNLEIKISNSKHVKWSIDGEEFKENDENCTFTLKHKIKMLLPTRTIERIRG